MEDNFYTYAMIKPDGMEHKAEILKKIYEAGLDIDYYECGMLSSSLIDENYAHCEKFDFYDDMKKFLLSGPVLKMLIYDKRGNAVQSYRKLIGATKSWLSEVGTIRNLFGSKDENQTYKNTVHGSGSPKEACDEIIRFFGGDMLDVLSYVRKKERYDVVKHFNSERSSNMQRYVDDQIAKISKACDDYSKKLVL